MMASLLAPARPVAPDAGITSEDSDMALISHRARVLIVLLAGCVLLVGCEDDNGEGEGTTTPPTSVDTTMDVATVEVNADAGCTAKSAFAGNAGADLVIISSCTPSAEQALSSGGRITVDTSGEGYLDFTSTEGEKRIWVLHLSELVLCTIGPDEDPTTAGCVNGFAVWNDNNPDTVAVTPNATVTLVGTYVLIGYLEEIDQSIVLPFDGEVLVQGEPDAIPGEGERIEPGMFWSFGSVEERIGAIEEFPALVQAFGIQSWVVAAARHAELDGFQTPGALFSQPAVNLLGSGVFGTPDGGDMFVDGIFWEDMAGELTITPLLGSRGVLDVLAFAQEYDPGPLEELAAELGGESVVVYFDSAAGEPVAIGIQEQLEAVGFEAAVERVDLAFGREELNRAEEEGRPAILVTGF